MTPKREMLLEITTGTERPILNKPPALSSMAKPWEGFLLEEHHNPVFEADNVCWQNHLAVLRLDGPLDLEWQSDGQSLRKQILPGQVSILPAKVPFSARARGEGTSVVVSLGQQFLTCAASDLGVPQPAQPSWAHGIYDPLIGEMILALRVEARGPASEGGVYGESLAACLATHIMHRHSATRTSAAETRGGLSKPRLRRVLDFIQTHLGNGLSLAQMAAQAEYSPFHFVRLFKQSTGMSPHEYVTRCRVEKARELLLRRDLKISDVAVQVGFYDHSHLTHHFKRAFNLTPAAFIRRSAHRK